MSFVAIPPTGTFNEKVNDMVVAFEADANFWVANVYDDVTAAALNSHASDTLSTPPRTATWQFDVVRGWRLVVSINPQ